MRQMNQFVRMRRRIGIVLTTAVLMGLYPSSEAAYKTKIENSEIEKGLLEALGVLNGETDDGDVLTRLEFAGYIAKTMGVYENQSAVDYYTDMSAYTADKGYIATLCEQGIIAGSGGAFRPDDAITYQEATAMVARMLGYEQYAQLSGGFPNGYANAMDMLDIDVRSKDVTLNTAIEMIYEALNSYVYQLDYTYSEGIKYSSDNKVTYLEKNYDIKMLQGSITEAAFVSLVGDGTLPDNMFKIGETVIQSNDFEMIDAVGSNAIVFYREDEVQQENVLVYQYRDYEKDEEIVIPAKNFEELDGQYVHYIDENDNIKRARLAEKYFVIRNGNCVSENISERMKIKNGTITLIKSGDTDEYNVVKLDEYTNITVESINYEDHLIFSRNDAQVIDYENPEYLKFFYLNEETSANHNILDVNNVLSVYRSDDGKYLKILVSDQKVIGSAQGINRQEYETTVVVDGKEYPVVSEVLDVISVITGNQYIFRLNAYGEIAAADVDWNNAECAAYLYKVIPNDEGDGYLLGIYTETNEHLLLKCANRVNVDGESFSPEGIYQHFIDEKTGNAAGQLIVYKTNSAGEIKKIDTPSGDKMNLLGSGSSDKNRYANGLFYPNYAVHAATRYFGIPNDISRKQEFRCSIGDVLNFGNMEFYNYDETKPLADYVVSKFDRVTQGDDANNYFATMVSKIVETVNDDGDIIHIIYGLKNNSTVQLVTSDELDISQVQPGDLIRYATDWEGKVSNLLPSPGSNTSVIAYPYNNGVFPGWLGNQSQNYDESYFRLTYGYVSDKITAPYVADDGEIKYNSYIIVGYQSPSGKEEFVPFDRARKIAVFDPDRRGEKAYYGTFDEIKTYKDYGMDCDRIVISYSWPLVKDAFVYRAN